MFSLVHQHETEASLIQIIVQLSVSLVTTPTPTIHHPAAVIIGCQQLSWSSFTVFHINGVYFGFYMKSKWQFVCREAEYQDMDMLCVLKKEQSYVIEVYLNSCTTFFNKQASKLQYEKKSLFTIFITLFNVSVIKIDNMK